MDILLSDKPSADEIIEALQKCGIDDAVCSKSEQVFQQAKILLVKHKLSNVTVQLLDSEGYAIRQVTSKKRGEGRQDQLTDRQIAVIKALEKVLHHCKKEGIQLVGYSDELVALPAHISNEEISSAGALDINSFGVYQGADALIYSEETE
ncbi:response regulator [Neptuniibacter sp. CAU 1671]|uniref:response regulator n=1 Tax=Neptuniibacter sp. CAU 1671 TaxID=3032593 RepID=UPI0023DB016C|nr:response regulator [Neptuniibacter sp. CAU 1671]MDF2180523.1 response regulator [Neptuniibacter sp. CAU 1671]